MKNNRRPLAALIVILCAALIAVGYCQAANGFLGQPEQIGDERYIAQTNRILDIVIRKSSPAGARSRHQLIFSTNLFLAHGAYIKYFPLDILIKYADALKEVGINRIEIYVSPAAWVNNEQEIIAKYDALIKHIRELGLGLVISPEFHRGSFQVSRVSDLEKLALPAYKEIAMRYQPDIFIVIHEPTTMAERLGIKTTPQEWKSFVEKAVRLVKQASAGTKTGAGGEYYEFAYYQEWLGLPELDYMTLNIYNAMKLKTYNQMIRMARAAEKKVYIEETWRFPPIDRQSRAQDLEQATGKGIGIEKFQKLDCKWMEALTLYANAWGLEAVAPFWSTTFFKYVQSGGNAISYEYNAHAAEAIRNNERTDTFKTLKILIQKYGKTSTTTAE